MFTDLKNSIFVGRGASGIFLILRQHFIGGEVLVPANICYAAVYPVIYAGLVPVFFDVDSCSGNAEIESIKSKISSNTRAIIVPHMYGNPVMDIKKIKQLCIEKHVLLIEDCASCMGAGNNQNPVGKIGDYVIHSTGYSKIISLGYGGLIASDMDLNELKKEEKKLPAVDSNWEIFSHEFSLQYRKYRNSGKNIFEEEFNTFFCKNNFEKYFIFNCPENWRENIKTEIEQNLKVAVTEHRNNWMIYHQILSSFKSEDITEYKYEEGSVPWRYSLLITPSKRRALIDNLLEKKIPVSDWYPVVADLFLNFDKYPGASFMEDRIINFPLNIPQKSIKIICNNILQGFAQIC